MVHITRTISKIEVFLAKIEEVFETLGEKLF